MANPLLNSALAKQDHVNWELWVNPRGQFSAVAKPGSGAQSTHFGDVAHVVRLMNHATQSDALFQGWTEAGRAALRGLHTSLVSRRIQVAAGGKSHV